jgi:hypothetical protein
MVERTGGPGNLEERLEVRLDGGLEGRLDGAMAPPPDMEAVDSNPCGN